MLSNVSDFLWNYFSFSLKSIWQISSILCSSEWFSMRMLFWNSFWTSSKRVLWSCFINRLYSVIHLNTTNRMYGWVCWWSSIFLSSAYLEAIYCVEPMDSGNRYNYNELLISIINRWLKWNETKATIDHTCTSRHTHHTHCDRFQS